MLSSGDRGRGGEPLLLRRYLRSGGSGGRDGDNNSPPNSKWWCLLLFSLSICETLTFRLLVLFGRAIFGIRGPVLIPFTICKIHLNFQQMKFKDHFWIRISHKKKSINCASEFLLLAFDFIFWIFPPKSSSSSMKGDLLNLSVLWMKIQWIKQENMKKSLKKIKENNNFEYTKAFRFPVEIRCFERIRFFSVFSQRICRTDDRFWI